LESLLDLRIVRFQESVRDLSQGFQLRILNIFTFILGEAKQEDRTVRAKTNKQTKASSFTLPSRATRCLIMRPPRSASIRPRIARSTAATKLASGMPFWRANLASVLVLKNTHRHLYRSINYSF
jgi:hypothetical protein